MKNGEDISKWTIPQLKFWLKGRRLNQQGLKKVSFAAPVLHKHCYLTFHTSQKNFVFAKIFSFLLLIWYFFLFRGRVKAFNAIPYYREKIYDPDPERSYTKPKVEKLKTLNIETVQTELIDQQASSCSSILDAFPPHENTQFSEDFSVFPPFVPMDAFEQVKNSGKSMKKFFWSILYMIYRCIMTR